MRRLENRWELPLIVVTAALGIAAVTMLFSGARYMDGISKSAENNVVYEVMTTSPELTRLQMTIAASFLPGSSVTPDDVALRFGIVQNRMTVLGTTESRRLRQDSEEAAQLLHRMQTAVADVAPRMADLKTEADATAVIEFLDPLNGAAARFAALTTSTASSRIAENQAELVRIFWFLLADVIGLLACGICLILLLHRARAGARASARLDFLTRLPNRRSFNASLAEAFAKGDREGKLIVMMFDLDLFKHVNDTLGHPAGDRLLCLVAERLSKRLADALIFARLGGDEFAAIFRSPEAAALAEDAGRRVCEAFVEPFDLFGSMARVSASVGIAIAGTGQEKVAELLKNADLALYAVKEEQRGGYQVYEAGLKRARIERQSLAKDLEAALRNEELELHFQPIVSLESNRTVRFEALLRWYHPSRGWISPSDFIPIAEETSLILPIGRWVIEEACAHAATWPDDISIAINLSTRQFVDPELTHSILDALARHGLRPERLVVEITESSLIQNDASVVATLGALREIGIRIALDDFGTGYASLSYLTRFEFDSIKIDQSFVQAAPDCSKSRAIVETICDLAGRLGLTTVAEGIETEEQLATVRASGCDKGQGYHFDRPMPALQCATRLALEQLRRIPAAEETRFLETGKATG